MTYIIHGASGAQGKPVHSLLQATGMAVKGLRLKRDSDARAPQMVCADNNSVEQLAEIYRGAAGVFVHLPLGSDADRLRQAHNIVAALTEARPERVVISTSGQIIDQPGSILQQPDDTALPVLVQGVAKTRISHAVVAPRMFLENLLLPPVIQHIRSEGILRYPLRANLPVSWASHLDVADATVALFDRADCTGIVAVGQHPPITGPDLAKAFSDRLRRPVAFEAITPSQFGASIAPVVGEAVAARVVALYEKFSSLTEFTFEPERSAEHRLSVSPRTTRQWLDELGLE